MSQSPPELSSARPGNGRDLCWLLVINAGLATLLFALLEIWRPLYFLTDDNMDGGYPLFVGMGRRMLHGQSPFISDYLFGGNYNLLRDSCCFLWHPIYLVAALVANSPARLCHIELIAYFFLLVAATGFVCLAHHLRLELGLNLSDRALTFYAQSFTFSMIILCVGSSWVNFLCNHSALPWLALGILQSSWRKGLGLVGLFSLHHILGGHLEAVISASLFLTVFAAGVSWSLSSWRPFLVWIGGYAIAGLILSPLLVQVVGGFLSSTRSAGLSTGGMSDYAVPAFLFPFSYLFSTYSYLLHITYYFGPCPPYYCAGFVSCAAAWALFPALYHYNRWTRLEMVCAGIVALATLFIIRPEWLSDILVMIPLLRSIRWPFREIMEFQFFLHLFLVLRAPGGSDLFRRATHTLGFLFFITALPLLPAPSFNLMQLDREILRSGLADRYWAQVRTLLAPGDVLVPIADPIVLEKERMRVPFTLLGAFDYPNLYEVCAASGYSPTVPRDQLYISNAIGAQYNGCYVRAQEKRILAEHPNVRFITLESVTPLRITLSSPHGPPIDLTALPLTKEPK